MFMAAQLFNECVHTHPECKKPQITLLPTRILYVGSTDDSKVFLVVSGGRADSYTALSYCWGGSPDIIATEDTLEVLTKGIALSTLPNTIQDAVTVTRRLGLQYLWVDALCIRQDSRIDWELESSKMATIYGNATVTIASAGASNCNAGCFIQDISAENHMLERLPLRLPVLSSGTIFVCVQNYYSPEMDPLNKRAWALQERLLSPRVLIYTVGNISWQCQTKRMPHGIGSSRLPDFLFKTNPVDPSRRAEWSQLVTDGERTSLETSLLRIALDYSRRALTYGEDKLPALFGLASIFQELTGDVYLAGLWKKTVRQGLLCHIEMPLRSRPSIYYVPTWSWLSVERPILYRRVRNAFLVEILEAETVLAGIDRTGAISCGTIKLCGQMKQARHEKDESLLDSSPEEPVRAGTVILDLEWEVVNAIDGPLWCLRITEDEGLLLKPYGKKFQRVGLFFLRSAIGYGVTEEIWFEDCERRTITIV